MLEFLKKDKTKPVLQYKSEDKEESKKENKGENNEEKKNAFQEFFSRWKKDKTKPVLQLKRGMKKEHKWLIVGSATVVVLIIGGTFIYLTQYVNKVKPEVICDNIYIEGIEVSGMTKEEAAEALQKQQQADGAKVVTLTAEERTYQIPLANLGFQSPNRDKQIQKAVDYGKKGNIFKRYSQMKKLEEKKYQLKESYEVTEEAIAQFFEAEVAKDLHVAQDATMSRAEDGTLTIVKEVDGETLDQGATKKTIDSLLNDNWNHAAFTAEISIIKGKPAITEELLQTMSDELGSFWTDAGGGDRWNNLKRGAEKLNGVIIQPGEEFSVYKATAPYSAENGYVQGTGYENGKVVPAWGGGICQVSTTLYNAVILSELEIIERHPHSMLVSYVKPSRDAAIAGEDFDFRFKNTYDTPIYLFAEINSSNQLQIAIYGKDTRPETHRVDYESETLSRDPAQTIEVEDPSLAYGEVIYDGSAHDGCSARLWKVVYENDQEVSREIFNTSHYARTDVTIRRGTGGSDGGEESNEYSGEE